MLNWQMSHYLIRDWVRGIQIVRVSWFCGVGIGTNSLILADIPIFLGVFRLDDSLHQLLREMAAEAEQ